MTTLHVEPRGNKWTVKRDGNEQSNSTHSTQNEALTAARSLARDGDEIQVHGPNGIVREQVGNGLPATSLANQSSFSQSQSGLHPSDLLSVGTRVSWGAILAGVIIALAVYVTLNLLAFAVGISTIDQMGSRDLAMGSAFVSTFCLLVSLFIGGFIASRSTAGEKTTEAVQYGMLVWGTILLLLLVAGVSLGIGFFAGMQDMAQAGDTRTTVEALTQQPDLTDTVSSQSLAWWTFGGVILSALAAVAGSLMGSGPEMMLKLLNGRLRAVPTPAK